MKENEKKYEYEKIIDCSSSNTCICYRYTNLMNDAMTWVLILIPIAASLFCAWKAFCYQAADDNERIMIKKSVKGAVVVAILGECASAIIKLILSYYAS